MKIITKIIIAVFSILSCVVRADIVAFSYDTSEYIQPENPIPLWIFCFFCAIIVFVSGVLGFMKYCKTILLIIAIPTSLYALLTLLFCILSGHGYNLDNAKIKPRKNFSCGSPGYYTHDWVEIERGKKKCRRCFLIENESGCRIDGGRGHRCPDRREWGEYGSARYVDSEMILDE